MNTALCVRSPPTKVMPPPVPSTSCASRQCSSAAQGLHTKVAQVAAAALGLPLAAIYIAETATDKVPNASPTAASASSDMYGAAGAATRTLPVNLLLYFFYRQAAVQVAGAGRARLPDDAGSSRLSLVPVFACCSGQGYWMLTAL